MSILSTGMGESTEVIWGANVTNSLLRWGEGEFSSLAIKVGDTHVDIFVGCFTHPRLSLPEYLYTSMNTTFWQGLGF
jgi:hypothetical protein